MIQMIKSPIANPIMWKQKHLLSGMVVTLGAVSLIISNLEMIASMLTKVFQIAPWESMGGALLIFGLRLTDVPIGTLKTVLMVRGVRTWATLLGLLEVTIWITAMGRVMVNSITRGISPGMRWDTALAPGWECGSRTAWRSGQWKFIPFR